MQIDSNDRRPRKDSDDVQAAILAEAADDDEAEFEARSREWRDRSERTKANAEQRDRLSAGLADVLGVDLSEFAQRRLADRDAWKQQVAERRLVAQELARERVSRQKKLLKNVLEQRDRFEHRSGNPISRTCVWRAFARPRVTFIEADPQPVGLAVVGNTLGTRYIQLNPEPEGERARAGISRIRLSVESDVNEYMGGTLFMMGGIMYFRARVPPGGVRLLSVSAAFGPAGSYTMSVAPAGWLLPWVPVGGWALCRILGRIDVRVRTAQGDLLFVPGDDTWYFIHDHLVGDAFQHMSVTRTGAFEGKMLERNRVINVVAGDEVVVTPRYRLWFEANNNAFYDVHLAEQDCGLNVPFVMITLED